LVVGNSERLNLLKSFLKTPRRKGQSPMKAWCRRLLALLLSFTMTACGAGLQTYAGARLPPEKVAVLKGYAQWRDYDTGAAWSAELVSFDGSNAT
jgi:hypothetical protein